MSGNEDNKSKKPTTGGRDDRPFVIMPRFAPPPRLEPIKAEAPDQSVARKPDLSEMALFAPANSIYDDVMKDEPPINHANIRSFVAQPIQAYGKTGTEYGFTIKEFPLIGLKGHVLQMRDLDGNIRYYINLNAKNYQTFKGIEQAAQTESAILQLDEANFDQVESFARKFEKDNRLKPHLFIVETPQDFTPSAT